MEAMILRQRLIEEQMRVAEEERLKEEEKNNKKRHLEKQKVRYHEWSTESSYQYYLVIMISFVRTDKTTSRTPKGEEDAGSRTWPSSSYRAAEVTRWTGSHWCSAVRYSTNLTCGWSCLHLTHCLNLSGWLEPLQGSHRKYFIWMYVMG